MKFEIDIDYPVEKMEDSKKRMELRTRYEYYDRVPVNFTLVPRFFTGIFGIDYCEIFKDAKTQYRWLLEFAKYQLENIPCDLCTEPVIYVHPYFDNVAASSAFGSEVVWPRNETLHALPFVKDISGAADLKIPEPDAGLCGRAIEWWLEMDELARETRITFCGMEGRVETAPLSLTGLGPLSIAADIAGEDFYWWMLEYPDESNVFLDKITKSMILIEEKTRKIDKRPRMGFGLAEDSAQIMSKEMFRKFSVPYDKILFDRFGRGLPDGRGMHMCGNSTHLHEALADDLEITSFNGFGYLVPPEVAAKNLGGRMLLWGNIDPMLVRNGTAGEVADACRNALDALAGCKGFMLGDGANICPGTPIENLEAFVDASCEHAKNNPGYFGKNDEIRRN